MKTHIKILGAIYLGIAFFLAFFIVVGILAWRDGAAVDAPTVVPIILALISWFGITGWGLWRLDGRFRLHGILVGLIFMVVLNGLLLFADEGEFARSAGQKIFHLACAVIGLYTVVVLLLPASSRVFSEQAEELAKNNVTST